MLLYKNTSNNYSIRQLKLPLEIEKIIDISDPVYTFCEVVEHIDLTPYFVDDKGYKTGRPKCDTQKLLKVILFAFMEYGIRSLRDIEKLCRNDIRFMYLLDGMKVPSFATFGNFIRNELTASIEQIFREINHYSIGSMKQLEVLCLTGLYVKNLDFLDLLPDHVQLEMCGIHVYDGVDPKKWRRFAEHDICEISVNDKLHEYIDLYVLDN